MTTDIRLSVNFPSHPKTLKLIRKLGDPAAPWLLVRLWIYAAQQRPDGVLRDMDAEDIEAIVDWTGEDCRFVEVLLEVGYLNVLDDGCFVCHDWLEHNPWVAESENRSDEKRFARLSQTAPAMYAELKKSGVKAMSKKEYELAKSAHHAGKKLADIVVDLADAGTMPAPCQQEVHKVLAPEPVPVPIPIPKPKTTAAASSQASTTPTPPAAVEQQQQGNVVTIFADSEQRIRSAFKERHEFLTRQFSHLNLAVEEEQCVAKYRGKPIAADAAVLVLEWCKRVSVGKPEARSRDRPSRQAEAVQRGRAEVAKAMEAIYATEGV